MNRVILIMGLLLLVCSNLQAQDVQDGIDISDYLNIDKFETNLPNGSNLDFIRAKKAFNSVDPSFQIWDQTPWTDPFLNYGSPPFFDIGDINGDGFNDFVRRGQGPDERDSDLTNSAQKSTVHFGGSGFSTSYDEKYYEFLYPIGDLNGDGFDDVYSSDIDGNRKLYAGSASGLTEVASAQPSAELLSQFEPGSISFITGKDINEDGNDDIFGSFVDTAGVSYLFEIFGGVSLDNISATLTPIATDDLQTVSYLIGIVESAGTTFYLTQENIRDDLNNASAQAYTKSTNADSLIFANAVFLSGRFSYRSAFLADFNGDGIDDIAFDVFGEIDIHPGLDDGNLLFDNNQANIITLQYGALGANSAVVAGELDVEEGSELLFTGESNIFMTRGINQDTTGKFTDLDIYSVAEAQGSQFSPFPATVIGNLTGKNALIPNVIKRNSLDILTEVGIQEFPISVNGNTVSTTAGTSYTEVLERRKDIRQIWPLGDLEGDGVDNFAVELVDTDGFQNLWLYNGFTVDAPVKVSYPDGDTLLVQEVFSGNFTSTDLLNVAVLFRDVRDRTLENDNQLWIFANGDYNTPNQVIERRNLSSENITTSPTAQNAGDLNGDGFDDIVITTVLSSFASQTYLFKGGFSISETPDQITDYGIYGIGGFGVGGTVQGLGDLNGDGFDDFIVGDNQRQVSNTINPGRISGALYLHYGSSDFFDRTTPIDTADAELLPDTSSATNTQWVFGFNEVGTGDFNGDGSIDIVAKAFRHANSAFDNGVGALSFFFNDGGFSSQPDTLIPIRMDYIWNRDPSLLLPTEDYQRFGGRSVIKGVGDLDKDGDDELLYVPNISFQNGIVFGGGNLQENNVSILNSPNSSLSLYPSGNFINLQFQSAVGDYNGDGSLIFATFQNDPNYRDEPIYGFQLTGITVSNEEVGTDALPQAFELSQNYPNPFNPSTNINFTINTNSDVRLDVFDVTGRLVSTLVDGRRAAGSHTVTFNAQNLASGVYIYRLTAGNQVLNRKMILIK